MSIVGKTPMFSNPRSTPTLKLSARAPPPLLAKPRRTSCCPGGNAAAEASPFTGSTLAHTVRAGETQEPPASMQNPGWQ